MSALSNTSPAFNQFTRTVYLQRTALPYTETKSDPNDCVKLSVERVGNPASIAYYTTFVEQGCTQFPDPLKQLFTPGPDTLNNAASRNAINGSLLLSSMPDEDVAD